MTTSEILEQACHFLYDSGNEEIVNTYLSFMNTECNIPKTVKPIKEHIVKIYHCANNSNKKARVLLIPLGIKIFDDTITSQYTEYFKDEKNCLIALKRVLNMRARYIDNYPKNSLCGLLLLTVYNSHIENIKKYQQNAHMVNNTAAQLWLSKELIEPKNKELVKSFTTYLTQIKK